MTAKVLAAAAVTSTRVGKQPVRPEPRAMVGASSSAEPLSLKGRPRGSAVVVQVAAEVDTFTDVCALGTRIKAGSRMVADLQQKHADGV